jgi:D-xylose transport system ATP-binding protein
MSSTSEMVLDVRNVRKRFGAHDALKDVSLTVAKNEVVALLGDNGAGKSTMVKCLAGIHRPDSGELLVDGESVELHSPSQARHLGISAVFQDLAMFDNLSVAENFFAGVELRRPRWLGPAALLNKNEMIEQATEILKRLEVRVPNLNSPVGLLSGGQRQAVAVAKGVAFGKRLVILDEPTAALGLRERENVLRMVKRLPEQGVSVLLISHNLEEVIAVADRCVVLRQGVKAGECPATHDHHERMVSLIVGARTQTVLHSEE